MAKTFMNLSFALLLLSFLNVHAITDPLYGIKSKPYQRDPLIPQAFHEQQQQQRDEPYNPHYHGQQQYIQEKPLYERNPVSNGGHGFENDITEYYAGCPAMHTGPLPYPYDCRRFLNCYRGRGHIQSCGPGTVFNPQTLECDRPDKVSCGANAALGVQQQQPQQQTKPTSQRSGRLLDKTPQCPAGLTGLHQHPTDCHKFLSCANGQTNVMNCSPGTAFDPKLMICDYTTKTDCSDYEYYTGIDISCPPGVIGNHPHPHDSKKFLVCASSGTTKIEHCAGDSVFDSVSLVCVFSAHDSTNQYSQTNTDSISSARHESDLICPNGVEGLFAHPFDNTKFLNCKANKIAIQSCIADHVFSISKGYCVSKTQLIYTDYVQYIASETSYDHSLMLTGCPPGTDGLHLYPYDGLKYIKCRNGVMTILSCENDFAFSISKRSCSNLKLITPSDRVKFDSELKMQVVVKNTPSYGETQVFQSSLNRCPRGLNGLYPYSFHSTKYILCQNGILQIETCASGQVFSLSKKQCALRTLIGDSDYIQLQTFSFGEQFDTFSHLADLTTVTCLPHASGFYLHPFDCTKYLNCHSQQTLIESCEAGHVFSISKRQCIPTDQVEAFDRVEYLTGAQNEFFDESRNKLEDKWITPSEDESNQKGIVQHGAGTAVTCAPGATGLHPHPYDCSKFLSCANGQTYIQNCGTGTAWSVELEVCDYIHKVDCASRGGLGLADKPPVAVARNDQQRIKCPSNVYGLFPHPFDNRKFVRCQAGYTSVQSCPRDNLFSLSRSFCLPESNVPTEDRVSYLSVTQTTTEINISFDTIVCPKDFMGAYLYPFDCTKYISCSNGLMELKACSPDMYFSISHGTCLSATEVEDADRAFTLTEIESYNYWIQQYGGKQSSSSVTLHCPAGLIGLYHHPYDETKFLSCRKYEAVLINTCPHNKVFSVSRRLCLVLGDVPVNDRSQFKAQSTLFNNYESSNIDQSLSTGDPKCSPNANGLQSHPFDCTKFLNCANGVTYVQDCGPGTAWSPALGGCDFKPNVDCSGRDGRTNNNAKRKPKAESNTGADSVPLNTWDYNNRQHQNTNAQTPSTSADQTNYGDRWSNMNMQRPSGIDQNQYAGRKNEKDGMSTWSGIGRVDPVVKPTQEVLIVEGSLMPNRNYEQMYHTPLAPFTPHTLTDYNTPTTITTTTLTANQDFNSQPGNVFYAQPVNSQEDSYENTPLQPASHYQPTIQRQNHSREINYGPTSNSWQPVHSPSHYDPYSNPEIPSIPNSLTPPQTYYPRDYGQAPLLETDDWRGRVTEINVDNLPVDGQFELTEQDQFSSGSTSRGTLPVDSNLYGGLQPPPMQGQAAGDKINRPHSTNPFPNHKPTYVEPTYPNHRQTYTSTPSDSNLYGGLQPPPVDSVTTTPSPPIAPSHVLQTPTRPTPSSSVRTYQIYPSIANSTNPKTPNNPHYSPSYSGVAHSHNATWMGTKVPQPVDTQKQHEPTNFQGKVDTQYDYEEEYDDVDIKTKHLSSTSRQGLQARNPLPFNREYYSTPKTSLNNKDQNEDDTSGLPISEAIRMLLKPYFNRSGTVDDSTADRAQSHIMSLMNKPTMSINPENLTPTPTMTTTSTTTKNPKANTMTTSTVKPAQSLDDYELILAGEQVNLINTISVPAQGNREYDIKTDSESNNGKATNTTNWQTTNQTQSRDVHEGHSNFHRHNHHHSADFHRRHPNLPNPFTNDGASGHRHFEHSQSFHQRHPKIPNPFNKHKEPEDSSADVSSTDDIDELPNPKAESTTVRTKFLFDVRSGFSAPKRPQTCEFDCGNGRCVKQIEVCDGVANCGNRKDESQCDHLGYEVRLTDGESNNMGRVEVKILGKWGYVCDDKFGLRDADVLCKELGFKLGASEVRGNSYYPPLGVDFAYAMDEIECHGNETKLKDCEFKGWGVHNCGPDEVVGVVCKVPLLKCPNNYWLCSKSKQCIPPAFVCDNTEDCLDKSDESEAVCNSPIEYRLEGGRSVNEGRLEVKYHGEWGTICDDDFSIKEAQVACNSLGFYGRPKLEKNIFGPGSGPIWLDQVSCIGNETSLDKCNHWTWGEHNCNHTEDVGLRCTAGPPPRRITSQQSGSDDGEFMDQQQSQTIMEGIGLYAGQWERSSKFLGNQRRCGHYNAEIVDEYAYPEQRVINGTIAKRGRHPWQATIRTRGRGGISSHWCGAVLISKRHLLTAAHCLAGYPKDSYFVRLGDHYANIAESSETDSYIENWYIHEKFRQKTHMNNDIAVIVLKTPVKFNDYVQPICLPEKGTPLIDNRICTISGWGSIKSGVSTPSNILRSAQLPILPDETCKLGHVYGDAISEGMFCAGSMDESVDACDGDSGGPLVCSDDDGETLYGIISWGQHCGYINKPGVYVRVEKYIDWIYEKINFSMQH